MTGNERNAMWRNGQRDFEKRWDISVERYPHMVCARELAHTLLASVESETPLRLGRDNMRRLVNAFDEAMSYAGVIFPGDLSDENVDAIAADVRRRAHAATDIDLQDEAYSDALADNAGMIAAKMMKNPELYQRVYQRVMETL